MEALEVDPVVLEALDIAELLVADQPLAAALPAPVEGRDRKAARLEVGDGLEILLDELGPPLHEAHRARCAAPGALGKGRIAQLHPVAGHELADPRASGTGLEGTTARVGSFGIDDGVHAQVR